MEEEDKLKETIGQICKFLLHCKHQSVETEADRNCLVLNVEDICRKNLGYVPISKDLCSSSSNKAEVKSEDT